MDNTLHPKETEHLVSLLQNDNKHNVHLGLTILSGLKNLPKACILALFELASLAVELSQEDIKFRMLTDYDLLAYDNYALAKKLLAKQYSREKTEAYLKGFKSIHLGRNHFSTSREDCTKRYTDYREVKYFFEPLIHQYKNWQNETVYACYQYIFPSDTGSRGLGLPLRFYKDYDRTLSSVELNHVLLMLEPVIRANPQHFYANVLMGFSLQRFGEDSKTKDAIFFWEKALKTAQSFDWDTKNKLSQDTKNQLTQLYSYGHSNLILEYVDHVSISYIYRRICLAYHSLKQFQQMELYAREALKKTAEDINTPYYLLGFYYYQYGQHDQAIPLFQKGIDFYQKKHHLYKKHPSSSRLLYNTSQMSQYLAGIYINNKENVEKAMQNYGLSARLYAKLSPEHPQLQAILVRQLIIVIHIYKDYWQAQHLIDKLRKANKYHPAIQKYKHIIKEKTRFS
ncbi:MAG: hypothetical protein MK212_02395 [Saprospiraceae bacterium]|nr:hypothetical protein [Saprospiraceae bacterium]